MQWGVFKILFDAHPLHFKHGVGCVQNFLTLPSPTLKIFNNIGVEIVWIFDNYSQDVLFGKGVKILF